MHARTTTVQARQSALDEATALVRDEVMARVQALEGNIGVSMLVDREPGRCIITTAWADREAMRESAAAVQPLRDRVAEVLGAAPTVQEWEIAVLHRRRPSDTGACARVTWVQGDPTGIDRSIDVYRSQVLTGLDDMAGFCGASFMVDRDTGRAVSSVAYESREMLEASRRPANDLRNRTVQTLQTRVLEVAELELVLSELRVPETV